MQEIKFFDNALRHKREKAFIQPKDFIKPYQNFELAKDFILDQSRQIMFTGGRRGCKTTSFSAKIGFTNLFINAENKKSSVFYASKTFEHAMDLMWENLSKIKDHFDLDDWNMNARSAGKITTPRGQIKILGFNDIDSIAKAMGMPFDLFIIDESQEIRDDVMRAVVRDAASWGTYDNKGTLVIGGNPARNKHTFYAQEWLFNDKVVKYHTSLKKNPSKTAKEKEDFLTEQRELRGLEKGKEDAEFKRMAYGDWVFDSSHLIFKVNEHNYFDTLPKEDFNYILGIDVGYSAFDAYAVLAYQNARPKKTGKVFLVYEHQANRQSMDEMTAVAHKICKKFNIRDIVIDTGALVGKALPDIQSRYSMYSWIQAEKREKMAWIETLEAEINLKNFKMKKNGVFDKEIPMIEYTYINNKKVLNEKIHHSDMLMAIAYPFRYIYNNVAVYNPSLNFKIDGFFDKNEYDKEKYIKKPDQSGWIEDDISDDWEYQTSFF